MLSTLGPHACWKIDAISGVTSSGSARRASRGRWGWPMSGMLLLVLLLLHGLPSLGHRPAGREAVRHGAACMPAAWLQEVAIGRVAGAIIVCECAVLCACCLL